jgi:hypothetical protein
MTTKKRSRWNLFSRNARRATRRRSRRPAATAREWTNFRGVVEPLEERRLLALSVGEVVILGAAAN